MEEMLFASSKATSNWQDVTVALFADRVRVCQLSWTGGIKTRKDVYLDSVNIVERRDKRTVWLRGVNLFVPIRFKKRDDCERFCKTLELLR